MEGEAVDFHDDWELLLDSPHPAVEAQRGFDPIEDDSEGMIRADYFSIDGSKLYAKTPLAPSDSAESDNPSWVDPGYDSQFAARNPAELWSDSGSDLSDERKFSDFGPAEGKKDPGAFEGPGAKDGDVGFGFDSGKLSEFDVKSEVVRGDLGEFTAPGRDSGGNQFWSDSGGDRLDKEKFDAAESRAEPKAPKDEGESTAIEKVTVGAGGERRRIVWWKVPFEVLRYCVLRVGPVWSFSVAAAVVGLVILGRRLHKMKQKSRTLQLKVTLDDKKVSQFMSRAARLNEAFSVVRRVPIVRPALPSPAAGVAPSWPMMSLR
ncbi:hypothetical protein CDL15_Pgr028399 [Punica granatum]|nr:hypothetical protein CDL15_Pgr028399 [Punica granatum]